ncbi:hypothetical protein [Amycolatopsis sp. NPDC021455]|uniref:hypothetical protein n=1 Tax=Amycolatopsis sp. NPDC021455 TaxID=3154901 RepID=UPI0034015AA5
MTAPLTAAGPLFGPDFVLVVANDENGVPQTLQIYPDANNLALRSAGLPAQYYWQPARIQLAKKPSAPEDFDFGMTIFKGLMTSETTVGTEDETEIGGGFCTFTTTLGISESVIANALKALKEGQHSAPVPRISGLFFDHGPNDPDPLLGPVTVLENTVTINVPLPDTETQAKAPLYFNAQGGGKGSIEEHGFSSFLVTLNEYAAGIVAGGLKNGNPPFLVTASLHEIFYVNQATVTVHVDVDKVYDAVSFAAGGGIFGGIFSATLEHSYSSLITSGGIRVEIESNDAVMSPEAKQWLMKNADDMRTAAFNLVKQEIFDWKPNELAPANLGSDRGWFSSIFGGASVSLKSTYQRRGLKFDQQISLKGTMSATHTVSGDLTDLGPAVKAHLERYLAVVDIGEYFKKIQVAGASAVNFGEKLPDGTDLRDPIQSVQLEVSYPDYSAAQNGQVNLVTQAQGQHYLLGQPGQKGPTQLAMWTKDNPRDIVNISALRLDKDLPNWPADQVKLTKTIVFDGDDPRVELADGTSVYTIVTTGTAHAPKLTADEVGYVFVRFLPDRVLQKDNITITVTARIGARTDTITITKQNQKVALWEIFSDKYVNETSFSYGLQVEVTGPNFTDEPVVWGTTTPITVPLNSGRLKCLNPLRLVLPAPPSDKVDVINTYIKNYPVS